MAWSGGRAPRLEGWVVAVASKAASGAAGPEGAGPAKDVGGIGGVVANPESRAPKSPAGAKEVEVSALAEGSTLVSVLAAASEVEGTLPSLAGVGTELASGGGGEAPSAIAVAPADSGTESSVDVVASAVGLESESVGEAGAVDESTDPSGALDASGAGCDAGSGADSAAAPSPPSLVPASRSTVGPSWEPSETALS